MIKVRQYAQIYFEVKGLYRMHSLAEKSYILRGNKVSINILKSLECLRSSGLMDKGLKGSLFQCTIRLRDLILD